MNEAYHTSSNSSGSNSHPTGWQSIINASCHTVSLDLKAEGRNALLGHLGVAVGANIFYFAAIIILNLLVNAAVPSTGVGGFVLAEIFAFLVSIFSYIFEYGLDTIYLNLQYGQETRFSDLFAGLHENQNKIIRIGALLSAIRILCTLPAVICAWTMTGTQGTLAVMILGVLGAIADAYFALVFSQTLYVLLDYPDMNAGAALRRSAGLMKGRKHKLLYVELSFLPLDLLALISFGIAGLWVYAYRESTSAAFYRRIMEEEI